MIPYGRQYIDQADIEAVKEVLGSDFLTQGPAVPRFESTLCDATGAAHAVAANSATSALHAACLALGLEEGGLLWTSTNSFVASSNVGLLCGAGVDFVDIDPSTRNMSVEALAAKLETAERAPDILMPVHFSGRSSEMEEIAALARAHGARVIEDASHAVGGQYAGQPIGSCAHSDIAVFSFHPVKVVTTGEGGAALTNDPALADRLRLFISHGVTRDPRLMQRQDAAQWEYDQVELGLNYRMTDIAAALGASQMRRLEGFVAERRRLAERYDAGLREVGLGPDQGFGLPLLDDDARHHSAWHLYVLELPEAADKRATFAALREAGVGVNVHYQPIHTQPYYQRLGFGPGDFPNAERYYARAITLPLHPQLSEEQQDFVIATLRRLLPPV